MTNTSLWISLRNPVFPQTLDRQRDIGCLRVGSRHRSNLDDEHADVLEISNFRNVDRGGTSSFLLHSARRLPCRPGRSKEIVVHDESLAGLIRGIARCARSARVSEPIRDPGFRFSDRNWIRV